jgi:hypothetical protein
VSPVRRDQQQRDGHGGEQLAWQGRGSKGQNNRII